MYQKIQEAKSTALEVSKDLCTYLHIHVLHTMNTLHTYIHTYIHTCVHIHIPYTHEYNSTITWVSVIQCDQLI